MLVELLILYAHVQFYTHRALDYCLISQTGFKLQSCHAALKSKNKDGLTTRGLLCQWDGTIKPHQSVLVLYKADIIIISSKCNLFSPWYRAHQTRRSGRLLCLGFNEVAQFLSKSEVLVALSVFTSPVFFSPIIILFLQYSHKMFLKCDPYRIWCSIFYSKLVNCILLRSLFIFVKGRGTCGSGERNVKI